MTVLVDTHRLVTELETKFGFSKDQAAGVKFAIEEINLEHVATKADLKVLEANLETKILKWMVPMLIGQAAVFAGIVAWVI